MTNSTPESPVLHSLGNSNELECILELVRYNDEQHDVFKNLPVDKLLSECADNCVNWINIDGVYSNSVIEGLSNQYNLHKLILEDIESDHQPKAEEYDDYLFFTMKMLYRIENNQIDYEQISFVLGKNYLISFQQKLGDPFNPLRDRIKQHMGLVRKKGADYLMYRLIDTVVDTYYVVLDSIEEHIEEIEETVLSAPKGDEFVRTQQIKKDIIYLRKAIYPLREAISKLLKGDSNFIDPEILRFYSDIYDHVLHLSDALDTYRDLASGLMDICMNALNTRMNEVMKVLAIFSTIFMPLTFVAGIYGMNFKHMPELRWTMGYPSVLILMGVMVLIMIGFFKHKRWL